MQYCHCYRWCCCCYVCINIFWVCLCVRVSFMAVAMKAMVPWIHLTKNKCYCVFVWYFPSSTISLLFSFFWNIHNDVQTRVLLFTVVSFSTLNIFRDGEYVTEFYVLNVIAPLMKTVASFQFFFLWQYKKMTISIGKRVNWPLYLYFSIVFYFFGLFFAIVTCDLHMILGSYIYFDADFIKWQTELAKWHHLFNYLCEAAYRFFISTKNFGCRVYLVSLFKLAENKNVRNVMQWKKSYGLNYAQRVGHDCERMAKANI